MSHVLTNEMIGSLHRTASHGPRHRHSAALLPSPYVFRCVAEWCSVLQSVAERFRVLQCVAVCRGVSQCVAVCCRVWQCVAVCCFHHMYSSVFVVAFMIKSYHENLNTYVYICTYIHTYSRICVTLYIHTYIFTHVHIQAYV